MSLRKFGGRAARLLFVASTVLGCSSSDPATGGGGAGGSSASAGAGGSSASAGGGNNGTSGAGTGGGSASAGASGAAPASVFNPDLPIPRYDCRNDTNTVSKTCISLVGSAAGVALEDHCSDPLSPNGLLLSPPTWPTGCGSDSQHRLYNVDVPVQDPGPFHYTLMPGAPKGPNVLISVNDAGGDSTSDNFVISEIAGVVTKDASSGDSIVAGTFRATWSMPTATCDFLGSPCAAGDFNGTFRSDNNLKP